MLAHGVRVIVAALADGAEFHIEPERDCFTSEPEKRREEESSLTLQRLSCHQRETVSHYDEPLN
jgi:LmbE family N-acetylglucosaminyl deacetylase